MLERWKLGAILNLALILIELKCTDAEVFEEISLTGRDYFSNVCQVSVLK